MKYFNMNVEVDPDEQKEPLDSIIESLKLAR